MTLTTIYLSFWERVRKEVWKLKYAPFALIAFGIYLYFQVDDDLSGYLMFVSCCFVMWTVAVFTLSWRLVNEVHFANDKILIVGYTLNTRWEKEIDIKSSRIEIRSKNTGRSRDEYYLRIKSSNKSQDINGTYNWDYTSLLTIFHEFKRIKGEKITSGEEYDLDIMDKKSKGLSTSLFDFSFNWKRNNK